MGRRIKNSVILINPNLRFTYELTFDQLEQFLDRFLDIIIDNETDDPRFKLRIASVTDGLILNTGITKSCFDEISRYLNEI